MTQMECIICLERTSNKCKMPCCSAFAHKNCLTKWKDTKGYITCPGCRYDFSEPCEICKFPAQKTKMRCCGKMIHRDCLIHVRQNANLNRKCPFCRYDFDANPNPIPNPDPIQPIRNTSIWNEFKFIIILTCASLLLFAIIIIFDEINNIPTTECVISRINYRKEMGRCMYYESLCFNHTQKKIMCKNQASKCGYVVYLKYEKTSCIRSCDSLNITYDLPS